MRRTELIAAAAVVLVGSLVAVPVAGYASDRFTDVPDSHVFHDEIDWLADSGITVGCNPPNNDRFCPDDFVTRGQMAVFVVRAMGYTDDGGGNLFTDDDGLFYENAADMLFTAGVTRGCNPPVNDMFCGNADLTRGQMAAILVRAMGYTDDGGGNLFTDDDGHFFEDDIDKLGAVQVTLGCNPSVNERFCPNDFVTRGQMAASLRRALDPSSVCGRAVVPEQECMALVALYEATGGDEWGWSDSWLVDPNVCAWFGVDCESSKVTGLDLLGNHLTGPIPPEIGNLTNLTTLSLVLNQLTGPIPAEIGNLTNLQDLDLERNQLTGLPAEIGNLTNLQDLNLYGNQLTGLPAEIGNLANLQSLILDGNPLAGPIPAEIGNLTNLRILRMSGNQLTGPIPTEIGNLTNLQRLNLSSNQLTGPIPTEIGNLTNLESLSLRFNQLTGPILAGIGNLTNLRSLSLGSNRLTGPIPTEIGNLTNLSTLELGDNHLTGPIPTEIGNLTNLWRLYMENNQLTGSIPTEIGNLANLEELFLEDNELSGEVPTELQTETRITRSLRLRGQTGCLYTNDAAFEAWLTGLDPLWDDGCPA